MTDETATIVLSNRSFLWNLVARGFAEEPDQAFLEVLCSEHAQQEAHLVEDDLTDELAGILKRMVQLCRGGEEAKLREEYVRLFVGPNELNPQPWESVFRGKGKALFTCGVLQVRDAYREAGFLPAGYPRVADDFIGIECDFIAKLADSARDCALNGEDSKVREHLRQSQAFEREHLGVWAGSFAEAMRSVHGECLYSLLAELANCLVRRDKALLQALLG